MITAGVVMFLCISGTFDNSRPRGAAVYYNAQHAGSTAMGNGLR
jgi:hypothetical protein